MIQYKMLIGGAAFLCCNTALWADTLKPVLDASRDLQGVQVIVGNTEFLVNPMGNIVKVMRDDAEWGEHTAPVIESGSINGVPVQYEPCNTHALPHYPNQSVRAQQFDQAMRSVNETLNCPNGEGTQGKVQQIGPYVFSYYPQTLFNSTTMAGPDSGNVAKLKTAGSYHFLYYPLNAFGNQGGKLSSMTQDQQ